MKATDKLLMQQERMAQAAVHDYMEHFVENWAPSDRRENARFQADFLLVVQAIHRDAMKPIEKAMTAACSMIPPSFLKSEKSK